MSWGVAFIAGIYVLGGVVEGAAYWIIGGVMVVVFFAGLTYLGRQGQKASIRERASRHE